MRGLFFALAALLLYPVTISAAEKTFHLTCDNHKVSIVVDVDANNLWRGKIATMTIGNQPPEKLVRDYSDPSATSYKNKKYEFYSFQRITTLNDNTKKKYTYYQCDWKNR